MTGTSAALITSHTPGTARPGLIDRQDLLAALDRAAERKVTVISAPAGSGKTSLLRTWADRTGRCYRIVFMSVRPGQQDAQAFWLALLAAPLGARGLRPRAKTASWVPGPGRTGVEDRARAGEDTAGQRAHQLQR